MPTYQYRKSHYENKTVSQPVSRASCQIVRKVIGNARNEWISLSKGVPQGPFWAHSLLTSLLCMTTRTLYSHWDRRRNIYWGWDTGKSGNWMRILFLYQGNWFQIFPTFQFDVPLTRISNCLDESDESNRRSICNSFVPSKFYYFPLCGIRGWF